MSSARKNSEREQQGRGAAEHKRAERRTLGSRNGEQGRTARENIAE